MPSWNSRGLRGSMLEEALNMTNEQYRKEHLALVQKIPTPITPINIDKEHRHITLAYFEQKSTVDYIGNVQGVPICFDAKECAGERFALQNIHEHQISHMQKIMKHGGITFFIILMNNIVYLLKGEDFIFFVKNNQRKSIPYQYLLDNAYEIKYGINPELDYLKIVDKIYFRGDK